jgi:ketosteroid isomerase-like protein
LEGWAEAAQTKDIDLLMSLYSRDIVYFDVGPPLRFTGSAEVRDDFLRWFDGFHSSIGAEIYDAHIMASGDVVAAFMFIRASGTLKDGRDVDYWVRATVCWERSGDGWFITHEHVSLPSDLERGSPAMDLVPVSTTTGSPSPPWSKGSHPA